MVTKNTVKRLFSLLLLGVGVVCSVNMHLEMYDVICVVREYIIPGGNMALFWKEYVTMHSIAGLAYLGLGVCLLYIGLDIWNKTFLKD